MRRFNRPRPTGSPSGAFVSQATVTPERPGGLCTTPGAVGRRVLANWIAGTLTEIPPLVDSRNVSTHFEVGVVKCTGRRVEVTVDVLVPVYEGNLLAGTARARVYWWANSTRHKLLTGEQAKAIGFVPKPDRGRLPAPGHMWCYPDMRCHIQRWAETLPMLTNIRGRVVKYPDNKTASPVQ